MPRTHIGHFYNYIGHNGHYKSEFYGQVCNLRYAGAPGMYRGFIRDDYLEPCWPYLCMYGRIINKSVSYANSCEHMSRCRLFRGQRARSMTTDLGAESACWHYTCGSPHFSLFSTCWMVLTGPYRHRV